MIKPTVSQIETVTKLADLLKEFPKLAAAHDTPHGMQMIPLAYQVLRETCPALCEHDIVVASILTNVGQTGYFGPLELKHLVDLELRLREAYSRSR